MVMKRIFGRNLAIRLSTLLLTVFTVILFDISGVNALIPSLSLSPITGRVETIVTVSGSGFPPSTTVTVSYEGASFSSPTANASGQFTVTKAIPASATSGTKQFRASVGTASAEAYFEVIPGSIQLSLQEGKMGATVAVTGQGFPSNTSVTIEFEGKTLVSSGVTTGISGGFSTSITIPAGYTPGTKVITARAGSISSLPVSFDLTSATITVNPTRGRVGTSINVQGQGFNPNERVSIQCDGKEWTSITSDSYGNIATSFNIPLSPGGGRQIKAVDRVGMETVTQSFLIEPAFSKVDALDVWQAGIKIRLSGNGFSANSKVKITLEGAGAEWEVTSDSSGSFLDRELTVDEAAGGKWKLRATDSSGSAISDKTYTVQPTIFVVGASSVEVGGAMAVQGRGFRPEESGIGLFIGDALIGQSAECDEKGSFYYTGTAPEMATGTYEVSAQPTLGNRIKASSSITIQPSLNLDSAEGYVNKRVTFRGHGYKANTDILLTWDNSPLSLESPVRSDSSGSLTGVFRIPRCRSGLHTIIVTDGTSRKSKTWTVENAPPSSTTLLSPLDGERIGHFWGQTPTFKWSAVEDPSGVYYNLSVARDESFKTIVLSRDNLVDNVCILAKSEALGRGNYYWRVRAVDGAYNESKWSEYRALQIGSNLPFWLLGAGVSFLGAAAVFCRFSIGFTTQQRTAIAKSREVQKAKEQEQREKENAEQERLSQITKEILSLAQGNRGALRLDSITSRLNIDAETAELCLKKLKANQEGDMYFFPDIEKKYKKKN